MRIIATLSAAVAGNALALLAARTLVPGFELTPEFPAIVLLTLVLTGLNVIVKPILKFFLAPFIILTLGVGLIVINIVVLYLLDFLSENLTIQGIPALIYSTLIVSAVNFLIPLFVRK